MILPLLLACTGSGDKPGAGLDSGAVDCPSPSTWYADADADGYGAGPPQGQSCERPAGHVANADDCDDADADVHPSADERCNGVDDDCDGVIDPDDSLGTQECHVDADGDGFGDPDATVARCTCDDGTTDDDTDCDDSDAAVHPGAEELPYDGIDQDCAGLADECDQDGDGWWLDGCGDGPHGDCDDTDAGIHPGALDLCDDDIDQDCDGRYDECGFASTTSPASAWWIVHRDETDDDGLGWMGHNVSFAGDSDGDGAPELLVREELDPRDPKAPIGSTYYLIEAPTGTSGTDQLLSDAHIARWAMPSDGESAGHVHTSAPLDLANIDLDGDGYLDYVLVPGTNEPSSPAGGAFLSYGPVSADVDTSGLDMVHNDLTASFMGPARLLVDPGEAGGWVVAHQLWPDDDRLEGTLRKSVVLLSADHYAGAEAWQDAPAIWSDGEGREAALQMEVEDLDGDGIRDIVATTVYFDVFAPTPRLWMMLGPFDGDASFADADVVIEGSDTRPRFGLTMRVLDDGDGDGHRTVLVAEPTERLDEIQSTYLFEPSALGSGALEDRSAAFARIDATAATADGVSIRPSFYRPSMTDDLDRDGAPELAFGVVDDDGTIERYRVHLMSVPTSGVVTLADPLAVITSDEEIDAEAGIGSYLFGDADFDGDGWSDLVVGEWYWDNDPDTYFSPYGRLMVFRGEADE